MIAIDRSRVVAVRLAAFLADRSAVNRSALAESCVWIVEAVAKKFCRSRPEEHVGAGAVGLMRAIDGYDPAKSLDFEGYVRWLARNEMTDESANAVSSLDVASADAESIACDDAAAAKLLSRESAAAALATMDEMEREIAVAHYMEGRSLRRIARERGLGRNGVRHVLARAMQRAAVALGEN